MVGTSPIVAPRARASGDHRPEPGDRLDAADVGHQRCSPAPSSAPAAARPIGNRRRSPRPSAARTARRILRPPLRRRPPPPGTRCSSGGRWPSRRRSRRPGACGRGHRPGHAVVSHAGRRCAHCSLSSAASVMTTESVVLSMAPKTGAVVIASSKPCCRRTSAPRRAPARISPRLIQHVAQRVHHGQRAHGHASADRPPRPGPPRPSSIPRSPAACRPSPPYRRQPTPPRRRPGGGSRLVGLPGARAGLGAPEARS